MNKYDTLDKCVEILSEGYFSTKDTKNQYNQDDQREYSRDKKKKK